MKKILVCGILILTFGTAYSQLGSWNMVNTRVGFDKHWSVFGEAQLRSWKLYDDFFYYEVKGGVNYSFYKNFTVTGGLGTYHTYQTNGNFKQPQANDEFRTWLQLALSNNYGRLNIDHRYRMEQRWTSAGYRNRFRYRFNVVVPLNHKEPKDKTIYAYGFDEIFLSNKQPFFERNRAAAGLGFRQNKHFSIQGGYLNQLDYSLTSRRFKGYFQVQAFLQFDVSREKRLPVKVGETVD